MSSTYAKFGLLVMMLAVSATACSGTHGEAGTNAEDSRESRGLGSTQEASCTGHTIVNVVTAPGTYHWEDPLHLLNSVEGFGPLTIRLPISANLSPFSESRIHTPTDSEVSSSVGFDITASFSVNASTTVRVPFEDYARVEAYATYQMTTWDILGDSAIDAVDTGTGVSYKPVGVYFKKCQAYDCSMGGGVVGGGPIASGPVPDSSSSGSGGTGGGSVRSGSTGSEGADGSASTATGAGGTGGAGATGTSTSATGTGGGAAAP
jgi:hypothetical protein